jgi:hypothetical protein
MIALPALVGQVKALLQPLNPFSFGLLVPMPASAALELASPALEPCPVEFIDGAVESGVLILCDHASNAVPPDLGDLGLPETEFQRHIAYDIGAAAVTRSLARRLGAPAILTRSPA